MYLFPVGHYLIMAAYVENKKMVPMNCLGDFFFHTGTCRL